MKSKVFSSLAMITVLVLSLATARAEVPGAINYQSFLTDTAGVPVDGELEMLFAIYDAETGGNEVWSQGPIPVTVVAGVYNVILGTAPEPLTPALLTGPRWLEVIVDGEYLTPRERIVSVLFALEAKNSDTVDGVEAADLEESAEIDAGIDAHAAEPGAHHTKTTSFTDLTDAAADAQIPDDITVDYAAAAGNADTVDGQDASDFSPAGHTHDDRYYTKAEVDAIQGQIAILLAEVAALQATVTQYGEFIQYVTVNGTDITLSGANLHIVSGFGSTWGPINGLGNLIVGYNEYRFDGTDDRTGSHNIVVGARHNYSSYGGLVVGYENTISGEYASVSGGKRNVASSLIASVSGGFNNEASGSYASVSGGKSNVASGENSSVSGGADNEAIGSDSSVSGGLMRNALDTYDWVAGTLWEEE